MPQWIKECLFFALFENSLKEQNNEKTHVNDLKIAKFKKKMVMNDIL